MKQRGARLGQHFLKASWAAKALAHAASIQPDEKVIEIGPGKGALTKALLAEGGSVIAIEKDEALAEVLRAKFPEEISRAQLQVVEGDVRDFVSSQKKYVVAANIPYYITGEIIRQFLTSEHQPRAMALLVQKEVAQRIVAQNKKESILSLSVKAYGMPSIVAKVSRKDFSPAPSVDSAILLIENISRDFFRDLDEDHFFKIVRAGFSSKRKFLSSNLAGVFPKADVMRAFDICGIDQKARAEDVPLETWRKLATELS